MTSSRLPGKVLHPVCGKPLLQYIIERLTQCVDLPQVILATSLDDADEAIVDFCNMHNVPCHRGPLNDVAGRFLAVIDQYGLDAFVRVCGDSPLLDPAIIECCLERFHATNCDLATNVFPRTFPRGQSVEVVRATSFRRSFDLMSEQEDREHVTRVFYRFPDRFHIENIAAAAPCSAIHLAVDEAEDLYRCEALIASFERPHWEYGLDEIVARYARRECQAPHRSG